jgi:hypothetical protein
LFRLFGIVSLQCRKDLSDYRRSLNKKSPWAQRTSGGPGLLPAHDGERHALPVRLGAHHTALHPAAVAPPHMPAVNAAAVVVISNIVVVAARGTTVVLTVTAAAAHELLLALTMLQQQQGLCHVIVGVVDAGVDVAHAHGGVSAAMKKPHAVVVVVFLSGGGHDAGGGLTRFPGYDDFAKGLDRRRKRRRRGEKRRMETTAAVGIEFAEEFVEVDVAVRVEQVGLVHVPVRAGQIKDTTDANLGIGK